MLDALKGLFSSKKFWLSTILAPVVLGLVASILPAVGLSEEMVTMVVKWTAGIMGGGVLGIGAADLGKEAAALSK